MRRLVAGVSLFAVLSLGFTSTVCADKVVLVAGGSEKGKVVDPFAVDFDKHGNMYFVEMGGNRLCRLDSRGKIATFAGNGMKGDKGDGGPAADAVLGGPHHLAIMPYGDILISDTWNSRVRKVDAKTGMISAIAGTGEKGFGGDGGPATAAKIGNVYCAALTPDSSKLYLADLDNRRIRLVDMKTGIITTVAGNGKKGVPEDGAVAVDAPLFDPRAVAADAKGNVWILERSGHVLRVVDAHGKIRTVAGTGKAGFSGDGGDARKAAMNGPKHLFVDHHGDILIVDTENHCIRKLKVADGTIHRVAGSGKKGAAGLDGPPEKVELNRPHGVYEDAHGVIYIADSSNNRILKIVK
jgi:hypothetical protein